MDSVSGFDFDNKLGGQVSKINFISSKWDKMKSFKVSINVSSDVDATKRKLDFVSTSNIFNLFICEISNALNMKRI